MSNNVSKRLFALVLCVLMLMSTVILPVSAADGETSGGYTRKTLAELSEAFNTISYEAYKTNLTEYYNLTKELAKASGKTTNEIESMTLKQREQLISEYIDVMNKTLRTGKSVSVDVTSYVTGDATTATDLHVLTYTDAKGETKKALYVSDNGMVTWNVNIPASGLYAMRLVYCASSDKKNSIERNFYVNGSIPFTESRGMTLMKTWRTTIDDLTMVDSVAGETDEEVLAQYCILGEDGHYYRFAVDSAENEIKPNMSVSPEWTTYEFKDADGMYTTPFEFYFEKGNNTIALKAVREGMYLASIEFYTLDDMNSYEEYRASMVAKYGDVAGTDKITVQAELPSAVSNYTIYPIYDRSSAISQPQHATQIIRNTIGGTKWENAGQWIEYTIDVETAGFYSVGMRFKQSVLAGMYVSRTLYIDGEVPFEGASAIPFYYDEDWQCSYLGDEDGNAYEFYLTPGTHTIRLEVTMGDLGSIISYVKEIQNSLNTSYLEIIKLTGTEPDQYRDYGFMRVMPNTIRNLLIQRDNLKKVLEILSGDGGLSANTVIFQQLISLLTKMGNDQNQIAKSLTELKNELGTLGEWSNSVSIQPLELDYLFVQNKSEKTPKASANFFQSLGYQLSQFWGSFFTDYNSLGASGETSSDSTVEVWVQSGRDQAQITRSIIQNEYKGAVINLKLVADGTLLPAVLSGTGPDVSLDGVKASGSLSQAITTTGDVINYAIRNAIVPLNQFTREYLDQDSYYTNVPSFTDVLTRFSEAALTPLTLYGTTYALPAKQTWPMMFVRTDILADLGEDIPTTWDELMALLPVLQYNNMEIGLTTDYTIYLYQMGSELWADDGMRINLDSNVALASFSMMCDMFTQYSLPYNYNWSNRFRTGEMPIFIFEYETAYNTLVVFATEISGMWTMAPIPGMIDENGNLNNVSVSTVTGVVMLRDVEDKRAAWSFMSWYTDKDFQVEYSNELVAVVGPAAKNATANMAALEELDWTHDEYVALYEQMQNLVSVEAYPGSYIIYRYTNFAFLDAYNDSVNPTEALLANITAINKEVSRKRKEFNLETLMTGQTLATKRMAQVKGIIEELDDDVSVQYKQQIKQILKAIEDKDASALQAAYKAMNSAVLEKTGLKDVVVSYSELGSDNEPIWIVTAGGNEVDSDTTNYKLLLLCKYLYDAAERL